MVSRFHLMVRNLPVAILLFGVTPFCSRRISVSSFGCTRRTFFLFRDSPRLCLEPIATTIFRFPFKWKRPQQIWNFCLRSENTFVPWIGVDGVWSFVRLIFASFFIIIRNMSDLWWASLSHNARGRTYCGCCGASWCSLAFRKGSGKCHPCSSNTHFSSHPYSVSPLQFLIIHYFSLDSHHYAQLFLWISSCCIWQRIALISST